MVEPTAFSEKPFPGNPLGESSFPGDDAPAPVVYRKISGFAIASVVIGVLFALFLIVEGAWAVRDQAPVLLPVYVQAVPCIGAALALVALFFIAGSEGTLAGRKLAIWGLGICVVGVLTYWAYFGALYMAVSNQADAFTRAWFKKLIDGEGEDYGAAFLDTQEPAVRQKFNPKDKKEINLRFLMALPPGPDGVQRGPLPAFREKDIVRLFRQGGEKTQVRSKGLRDWEFKSGGYSVKEVYDVVNDDGSFEIVVTVHGVESQTREFEGRAWYVVYGESIVSGQKMNATGVKVRALGKDASTFIAEWGSKLRSNWLAGAYVDTQDPKERKTSEASVSAARFLGYGLFGGAGAGPTAWLVASERQRYAPLLQKNVTLINRRFDADDATTKAAVLAGARRMLGSEEPGPYFMGMFNLKESLVSPWRYENNRLRLPLDLKLGFMAGAKGGGEYEVAAVITVESTGGALETDTSPGWRILSVELIDGKDRTRQSEAGPGMPQMPRGMKMGGPDPRFAPKPRMQ
jgi:hypothetical protein